MCWYRVGRGGASPWRCILMLGSRASWTPLKWNLIWTAGSIPPSDKTRKTSLGKITLTPPLPGMDIGMGFLFWRARWNNHEGVSGRLGKNSHPFPLQTFSFFCWEICMEERQHSQLGEFRGGNHLWEFGWDRSVQENNNAVCWIFQEGNYLHCCHYADSVGSPLRMGLPLLLNMHYSLQTVMEKVGQGRTQKCVHSPRGSYKRCILPRWI